MSIRSAPDEHPMVAAGKQVEDREMTVLRNVEGGLLGMSILREIEMSGSRNTEGRALKYRSVERDKLNKLK